MERSIESITDKVKDLTRHSHAKIVNSGNAAILAALSIAKNSSKRKSITIPDQGGWISFRTYPKMLGLDAVEVKTDRGIIDIKDLGKKTKDAAAFIVTSFAGYYAEQPMAEISKVCRKNKCLLIEDASGAIGDRTLCDGSVSDIIVGSFGRWKIVDLGRGGFISADKKGYIKSISDVLSMMKFEPCEEDRLKLLRKLDDAGKRLAFLLGRAEEIKKELEREKLNIFHRDKRGLNVVAGFADETEKAKIMGYCMKKGYEFVVCPKDIRVDEKAVSIEIKRVALR